MLSHLFCLVLQDFQVFTSVCSCLALVSSYKLMLMFWLQVCDVFFLFSFVPIACPCVERVTPAQMGVRDWAGKGFLFHDHTSLDLTISDFYILGFLKNEVL